MERLNEPQDKPERDELEEYKRQRDVDLEVEIEIRKPIGD